ncbi:MAG: MCP four helix bundle domain-containing protein [Bacteriovoracaceae bacterium]|nr:MCP four helix bundle domain-containing protein [Bacteriovoracaceae bacterium]
MEGKNTKSIKRSFATLTIFLLLISAIEMFISIQGSHTLSTNLKNVTDVQMPSLRLITLLDMLHDGLRSVVYSALLASASKNESELKSVQAELKEFTDNFNEHLSKLKQLDVTTNIKEAITKVEGPLNDYLASSKSIVDIALSDKTKEATDELPNFLASFKKLETELEVLVELIEKESETGKDQSLAFAQRNDTILKVTAFLGALVGILFFFFISRSTSKHLKNITGLLTQNSQDVNSLSESLGELSSHLSTSSQSQASSIQETASSLAEITSMMEKTKDSGNALKEASQQNLKLVEEVNENVK